MRILSIGLAAAMSIITVTRAQPAGAPTPTYGYRVVRSYPHDREAFTQGLIYRDGVLYEGTGLYDRSSIRKVTLETGEVLRIHQVPRPYFGEGITEWKGTIVELTWRTEIGFVYKESTFEQLRTFHFDGEGWGLTQDGTQLIMSDGSARLRFLDPTTFAETRRVEVHDQAGPVTALNELEYVRGEVYANIWQTDRIARISPKDGRVTGWIDLQGLLPQSQRAGVDVLNGIAYDAAGDRLFVTGKLWPRLYEIKIVPR